MQHELRLSDLRVRPISGFPYAAFYIVTPNGPEILRVLHTSRDIESIQME